MRTRIALVAIFSIALITVTLLTQAVTTQPARAAVRSPHRASTPGVSGHTDRLTSFTRGSVTTTNAALPALRLGADLLGTPVDAGRPTPVVQAPPPPPPAPVVVDTVTPAQRAEWERVAMCEEGGDWQSDGGRFSGGLGITRANWDIYGGQQYAPEGAEATPDQQIMVAERIQSYPPDQEGCRGW